MPSIQTGLGLGPRSSIQFDYCYPQRNVKSLNERIGNECGGVGAGFAAAFAKIGAVATAFLFPILPAAISTLPALRAHRRLFAWGSGHLGQFRVETAGGNLDLISEEVNRPQRGAKGDRLNAMAGKAEGERLATGHLGTELVMQAAEN
jgi:hypothetical protein